MREGETLGLDYLSKQQQVSFTLCAAWDVHWVFSSSHQKDNSLGLPSRPVAVSLSTSQDLPQLSAEEGIYTADHLLIMCQWHLPNCVSASLRAVFVYQHFVCNISFGFSQQSMIPEWSLVCLPPSLQQSTNGKWLDFLTLAINEVPF